MGRVQHVLRALFLGLGITVLSSSELTGQDCFVRGDCDQDLALSITDLILGLEYVHANGPEPPCLSACDGDDSGELDILDGLLVLNYLFLNGPPPAPPFPSPGQDPSPDGLGCLQGVNCAGEAFASSISQYGITWNFNGLYEVGQYVTGDYWVLGPVTVVSKTPAPTGTRHGSMLNPIAEGETAYDSRVIHSDMSLQVDFPILLQPGDSLVSMQSWTTEPPPYLDLLGEDTFGYVKNGAVLTVVSSPPSPTAFRPPYAGTEKPAFDVADVRWDLLPQLPFPGGYMYLETYQPDLPGSRCDQYANLFARPWMAHGTFAVNQQMSPANNQVPYWQWAYGVISDAALLLLCDPSEVGDQNELMIGFVQVGIDMHYCGKTGIAGRNMHKWPTIFAGLMLDNEELKNAEYQGAPSTAHGYKHDAWTYWVGQTCSPVQSNIIPQGESWTGATVLFGNRCPFTHEHLHPTEWHLVPPDGVLSHTPGAWENYRRSSSRGFVGAATAATIMNAVDLWDHWAFFVYTRRWMREPDGANRAYIKSLYPSFPFPAGRSVFSDFAKKMYQLYMDP